MNNRTLKKFQQLFQNLAKFKAVKSRALKELSLKPKRRSLPKGSEKEIFSYEELIVKKKS